MRGSRSHLKGARAEGIVRRAVRSCVESLESRLHLTASGSQVLATSPALFIQNQGQWADSSVRYVHTGNGLNIGMTDHGMEYQFYNASGVLAFNASLVNGRTVTPVGEDLAGAKYNYFIGSRSSWQSNVSAYNKVVYNGVYSGIDLETYGLNNQIKYEFHVAPYTNYNQIAVQYQGIQGLSLASDGSLQVNLGDQWGVLKDNAPYIYQVINGKQVQVAGKFVLLGNNTYGFQVTGHYDPSKELVIDPYVAWSSFIGGTSDDTATGITTDKSNNVLVTGTTYSAGWIDHSLINGSRWMDTGISDGYVVKYSPDGNVVWGAYVGGECNEEANGIAADSSGNAYVVGTTDGINDSSGWAFGPAGSNGKVMVESYHGGKDAFVMKLTATGQYAWAEFTGGTGDEQGMGISIAGDNVVITGSTTSHSEDVPASTVAPDGRPARWTGYSPSLGLAFSATVASRNASNSLQVLTTNDLAWKGTWSLIYGDPAKGKIVSGLGYNETGASILQKLNDLLKTDAIPAPVTSVQGTLQTQITITFASAFGKAEMFTADVSNIEVQGEPSFDAMAGKDSTQDAFAAGINTETGERMWARYIGGSGDDIGLAIVASDVNGFLTGSTTSTDLVRDGFHPGGARSRFLGTGTDAFIYHFDPTNGRRMGASLLNANLLDAGNQGASAVGTAIAMDVYDQPVIIGTTRMNTLWPKASAVADSTSPTNNVFAASFDNSLTFLLAGNVITAASDLTAGGVAVESDGSTLIAGGTDSADLYARTKATPDDQNGTLVPFGSTKANKTDGFVLKLDRAGNPVWGTFIGGNCTDTINAIAIDSADNIVVAGTTDGGEWDDSFHSDNGYHLGYELDSDGNVTDTKTTDGFVSKLSFDTTAPTISVGTLQNVTADNYNTASPYRFDITYSASAVGMVNRASLLGSSVRIMRNGVFIATATPVSVSSSTNAQQITVTYAFEAPNGSWGQNDAGTYTLKLIGGQIRNADGVFLGDSGTLVTLGSFAVDLGRPQISIAASALNGAASSYSFTVVYDGLASSISRYPSSLSLTGSQVLTASATNATTSGNKTTVTYTVSKPGTTWGATGAKYTLLIPAGVAANTAGTNQATGPSYIYVDGICPTAAISAVGNASTTVRRFTVTYDGNGTPIPDNGYPTTLTLTNKTNSADTLTATQASFTRSGNKVVVTYTFTNPRSTAIKAYYIINVHAGSVSDLAGNYSSKDYVRQVYVNLAAGVAAAPKIASAPKLTLAQPFSTIQLSSSSARTWILSTSTHLLS